MRSVFKNCAVVAAVAVASLVSVSTASAQIPASDLIESTFLTMGFDPVDLVGSFVGIIGPIFVTLLTLAFAFVIGRKILMHFKRSA